MRCNTEISQVNFSLNFINGIIKIILLDLKNCFHGGGDYERYVSFQQVINILLQVGFSCKL